MYAVVGSGVFCFFFPSVFAEVLETTVNYEIVGYKLFFSICQGWMGHVPSMSLERDPGC